MTTTVVGLYRDFKTAERVVKELRDEGIDAEDISLVARNQGEGAETKGMAKDSPKEGAAAGAGTGAVIGGVGGLLVGLGVLAIPGIGPILAAGPIATTLAGAGVGAAAGGIAGALIDAGVPEHDAKEYSHGVEGGGALVTVYADDNMGHRVASIMNRHNPIDINQRGWYENNFGQDTGYSDTSYDTGMQSKDFSGQSKANVDRRDLENEGETSLPIAEEDVRVGKREVDQGGVRIHKRVVEEPFEETHNVRSERVNVDRKDVNRPATDADLDNAFRDETLEVSETSEELVVDKRPRVTGEVHVSKDVEEHPETVHETRRRTEIDTEELPGGTVRSDDYGDFNSYGNDFRSHYNTSYSRGGRDYSYYEPAYRYGYDLGSNDRYQGRNWNDIEKDARRNWETTHSGSKWDDVKDAVRTGWEKVTGKQ